MVWCVYCAQDKPTAHLDGKICCSDCGKVLEEDNFSSEPTFVKNAAGQSQLSGNKLTTVQSEYKASRERTLNEAYNGIEGMLYGLGIDGGDSIARPALRFYEIAVEKNFTRGRRKEQVQAAFLYIACRYILGGVFLQLCKILSLEEHPIVQKPVDPSLFIHRFTDRRKPSGLCGAALYIASLSHGLSCSKSEIIKVVHICEATLTKRLIEFENTESGSLTIDEFNTRAEELEKEERLALQLYSGSKGSGITEVLCEHKESVKLPFAHGLCESCYTDFVKLSGGLDGGSEPPAFQRAERERLMANEDAEEIAEDRNFPMSNLVENNGGKYLEPEKGGNTQSVTGSKNVYTSGSEQIGVFSVAKTDHNVTPDTLHGMDGMGSDDHDESDNFSDIDDVEVDGYLHNEQEKRYKKIIWETMNREYLEEQAAKEADALAAKKRREAILVNCSEDAKELADTAAANLAKSRKEKQQKRAAELKNSGPAQSAAEATKQMLTKKVRMIEEKKCTIFIPSVCRDLCVLEASICKHASADSKEYPMLWLTGFFFQRLSSKINYDVVDKLFDESVCASPTPKILENSFIPAAGPENTKKTRHGDDSTDDNEVKSDKIDPEVDETYDEALGEDLHYDDDVGGYGYDQHYDYDDY
ncbi:hypothetical protein RND71_007729 [Anisodus tanguticus]|uniref:Transcription factor IIIB 90 kDa subunit n=1 Tax=Anisodus tanguticus TaxID=243964 RepID=A0AAE1SLW5_9SOLA|nr:hypothetical protein RND71_007729 [Anisodus tanguticus]